MCNACTISLDQHSVEDFGGKLVGVINNAGLAMMISVAHRTGLFDALAECESATSEQLAEVAGLNERYVRECLGALVTGEIVAFHRRDHGIQCDNAPDAPNRLFSIEEGNGNPCRNSLNR